MIQANETVHPELIGVIISGWAILGTMASSAMIGLYKKYFVPIESKIVDFIKPFQPIIVTVLGASLPLIFQAIGAPIQEDAGEIIAGAPVAGILVVTLRELLRRLSQIKKS